MERILVIGSPGAGKSTFSRRLREETGLPLYYLDMLWHRPDRTTVEMEVFDRELGKILEKDRWIIDGNYIRTLEMRLKACDTVFFLDYPLEVCLEGVRSRIGKPREDMPWVEQEFDGEFRQWIDGFFPGSETGDLPASGTVPGGKEDSCFPFQRRSRPLPDWVKKTAVCFAEAPWKVLCPEIYGGLFFIGYCFPMKKRSKKPAGVCQLRESGFFWRCRQPM